ncbi:DUF1992 domain-containing protein [Cellulomonas citrea]|uniref:DnaJ family domain-containing protein n=1 Tax=Cellulomonas citrea TaxID=1909423 RepID=UPI001F2E854A|nr:DUF1992 domain-containing protein [Cellulomonas citrea]
MSTRDPRRRASTYRAEHEQPSAPGRPGAADGSGSADGPGALDGDQAPTPGGPPRATGQMATRGVWVDHLVDEAIRRGEFDDLPLAGKPIPGLGSVHDPDWWLKGLVRREHVSGDGVLPEALALRALDERLDARLDALAHEDRVRAVLVEFNARVVAARRQLTGGPPVVTPLRDVEEQVAAWRERRLPAAASVPQVPAAPRAPRRRWWRWGRATSGAGDGEPSQAPDVEG